MTKQKIIKIVVSTLKLRLRTTTYPRRRPLLPLQRKDAPRLALRLPQKLKFFGGPIVMAIAIITASVVIGLNSCNVVRTITNKSEFWQKGDTAVTIQTKTIESYDASKKL